MLTDYARKGQTITGAHNRNLLYGYGSLSRQRVFLLHNNAHAHSAQDTVAHALSLGYQILPRPLYFPDMAPNRMKKPFYGRHFQNDNEMIFKVERFVNSQNTEFYNQGLRQVIHHWEKCVALKGEHTEKE